jgi:hypothetical protein
MARVARTLFLIFPPAWPQVVEYGYPTAGVAIAGVAISDKVRDNVDDDDADA